MGTGKRDFRKILQTARCYNVKQLKKNLVLWVVGITLMFNLLPVQAQAASEHIVRVAFPIQDGISYIDENGNYAGYLVD